MIVNTIEFPVFSNINCKMMPFIQGDPESIPEMYKAYSDIIENNFIEKGEIGFLTINESFVTKGKSQRGYNSTNCDRNVHVEVGHYKNTLKWGGTIYTWGSKEFTTLDRDTQVLIANSISDTCRVWNVIDNRYTENGDLTQYIDDYPEETGLLLKTGEVAKINILTPHECVSQLISQNRQFFRIVGKGVTGRESYFTINPLVNF